MKIGDKVILREFGVNPFLFFSDTSKKSVGKVVEIIDIELNLRTIRVKDETGSAFYWMRNSCDICKEPQEYFYVGQTVYSPFFQNKERKGVIKEICNDGSLPIIISLDVFDYSFSLDGKLKEEHDFISLFQEPIQFPTNKPIERFEEGEIVEYSNDGVHWGLGYFVGLDDDKEYPYRVCILKGMHDKLDSYSVWSKVKKFKK